MFSEKRYDDDEFLSERRIHFMAIKMFTIQFSEFVFFFAKLRDHIILSLNKAMRTDSPRQSLWANKIVSFAK